MKNILFACVSTGLPMSSSRSSVMSETKSATGCSCGSRRRRGRRGETIDNQECLS
jgi:hypothetical protein